MEIKKIMSYDAETNGLWGDAFSIGALLYEDGKETARFVGRCPFRKDETVNDFVNKHVLPEMTAIPTTHDSYEHLLKDFMAWRA